MTMYHEKKKLNGLEVTITRQSKYPLPYQGPKEKRPADYYAQISTTLTYTENDQLIEIIIPAVEAAQNRKRVLSLKVNGKNVDMPKDAGDLLDMNQAFDIYQMNTLLNIVRRDAQALPFRTCLPFLYLPEANYILDNRKKQFVDRATILKTNGHLEQLVSPYLHAMKNHPGQKKELYIPVVTYGAPHHWNVYALSIDGQNKPSLTYMAVGIHDTMDHYTVFCRTAIIPALNKALIANGYIPIKVEDLIINRSKQFSEEGCAIAVSLHLHHLMDGSLKLNPKPGVVSEHQAVSIEEDAIIRAQLAIKMSKHLQYIREAHPTLTPKTYYQFEETLNELRTHPRFLKSQAEEFIPPQKNAKALASSKKAILIDQIKQKIDEKKDWHFGGLIGYSRYKANDQKTMIPEGVRKILDILAVGKMVDIEKIALIKEIAESKKGWRATSIFPGFGLFTRSDETKKFYGEIVDLCNSSGLFEKRANNNPMV